MARVEITVQSARGSSLGETLRYLRAELRRRHTIGSSGMLGGGTDVGFESGYDIGLVYNGRQVKLDVRVSTDIRKEHPRFVVEEHGAVLTEVELQSLASEILLAAVDRARAGVLRPVWVRRGYAYHGLPLHGCYTFPGWRVRPLEPPRDPVGAKIPPAKLPQFIALDVEVDAIDELDANEISLARHTSHVAYLATFLGVPLASPLADYHLVEVSEGGWDWRQQWYPRGLGALAQPDAAFADPARSGRWIEDCRFPWRFDPPDGAPRCLYLGAPALRLARRLRGDPEAQAAFGRCTRLYHLSMLIPYGFATAALALRVAAVEALASCTPGCSQAGARERFAYLWSTFGPHGGPTADQLYGEIRSAMFHAGRFAEIDGSHINIDFIDDSTAMDRQHRAFGALRDCIIKWVEEYVQRTS